MHPEAENVQDRYRPRIPDDVSADPALSGALHEWLDAVGEPTELDPVLVEITRLRAAAHHDCRLCSSIRLVSAQEGGLDETLIAKIERYELSDLPERHKLALRLTDALMTQPGDLATELVTQLRTEFSEAELLSLTLLVMKWSFQKTLVALRVEAPDPSRLGAGFTMARHTEEATWDR